MKHSWKDCIFEQREALANILHEPLAELAELCSPAWGDCEALDSLLQEHFFNIPYCSLLYCMGNKGIQICNTVGLKGITPGHIGRDRSQRPYMQEAVPDWGFLLSDAYISLRNHRPALTALQVVRHHSQTLGYLGATFDLRNLPVTAELYEEPDAWRQVKGDPAIRSGVFQQSRVESLLDGNIELALSVLEELLTQRGVFQCQIHFSSSQAMIWTLDDPFRYRILDHEALSDPDICLVYPSRPYPADAAIPRHDIKRILESLQDLRMSDPTFYLRTASINLSNGIVNVTFSCDGSHYMPHIEFLEKGHSFWF